MTSDDTLLVHNITVHVWNVRSLSKHVDRVHDRLMNNDTIRFAETDQSVCKITEMLFFFSINLNNKCKFLSLAYICRNDVAVWDKFDANGVSILNFKKCAFAGRVFTLMLVYRKQTMQMNFFRFFNIY